MKLFDVDPPYDEIAERAILGSMLYDPDNIPFVLEFVREKDFYVEEHRLLFSVLNSIWEDKGNNWDEVVLKNYIEKMGLSERLPMNWVVNLLNDAVSGPLLEEACRTVKEKAGLRELLDIAIDIVKNVKSNPDFETIVEKLNSRVLEVSEGAIITHYFHISEVVKEVLKIVEKFRESKELVTGLPTGFGQLDMYTTGLHPSDLVILAARPGMGKSSFMLSVAMNLAINHRKPVAIFSLEMTKEQLAMRMLSSEAEVPLQNIRSGMLSDEDYRKLMSASMRIADAEIYIDDTPSLTTTDLRIKARKLKKEKGIELIAVDYLQLLRPTRSRASRQEEVAEISRNLKALAKELSVPVLALAQLSRQVEQRGDRRPQLADLRESGQIEQDADIIIFLHRPDYYKKNPSPEEQGIVEIIVAKQRQGPTGTIKAAFIKEYAKFSPIASPIPEISEESFNIEVDEDDFGEDFNLDL